MGEGTALQNRQHSVARTFRRHRTMQPLQKLPAWFLQLQQQQPGAGQRAASSAQVQQQLTDIPMLLPLLLLLMLCCCCCCHTRVQVVYGVLRYSRFLNAFLASFWDTHRWMRGWVAVGRSVQEHHTALHA